MEKTKISKNKTLSAALAALLALLVLSGVSFAWFSFTASATVREMQGRISDKGVNLLISVNKEGPFAASCELAPESVPSSISPISTSDMQSFYIASRQDADGVAVSYKDVSKDTGKYLIRGRVYLNSSDSDCDLYLSSELLDFGDNAQALAAMRFGLIFESGERYIFRLDDLKDTSAATAKLTVKTAGSVCGREGLVKDPALDLSAYFAVGAPEAPSAGANKLAHINVGETLSVEYFLWLEGCDENCFNDVRSKELSLSFGFVGI